jgi:hypothetical protein
MLIGPFSFRTLDIRPLLHYPVYAQNSLQVIKLKRYPITGRDRPLGLQEVEAPRISRQSAHEYRKFVRPKRQPPLPLRIYPWHSFLLEAESSLGP